MSDTLMAALIAVLAALAGWLMGLTFWLGKLVSRLDILWENHKQLQEKYQTALAEQQTAWGFQIRRAQTRTVQEGDATRSSPLTFTSESLLGLEPIKAALQVWWKTWDKKADDAATLLEIERVFGKRIADLSTNGRSHDSCLLTALAVACDNPRIELKLK